MTTTHKVYYPEIAITMSLAGYAPARLDTNRDSKPIASIRGSVPNGNKCIGPRNPLTYVYVRKA